MNKKRIATAISMAALVLLGLTGCGSGADDKPATKSSLTQYFDALRADGYPLPDKDAEVKAMNAGDWMCSQLRSGEGSILAESSTMTQFGLTPEQASKIAKAATSHTCPQYG